MISGLAPRRGVAWALALLVASCADAPPTDAARDGKAQRGSRKERRPKAAATGRAGCDEPGPVDASLAAGLEAYGGGRWNDASVVLLRWAALPTAASDPAAAKGFYALGYSLRSQGRSSEAAAHFERAKGLLSAKLAEAPTLEAYYYLSSLHQLQGDAAGQLDVVSRALRDVDAGTLCTAPDGDDFFRLSRLAGAGGQREREASWLAAAREAYGKGLGDVAAYRGLTEKALADSAYAAGDWATAEAYFGAAAALDPTIPDVHRGLGLSRLRQGNFQGALDHWRQNWTRERNDGNALIYAIPVLANVKRYRETFGAEHAVATADYTTPALEQNAATEGKRFLELVGERHAARAAGRELAPDREQELAVAEYRMHQFLLEYVLRGGDLSGFALQSGLLPAIHGRDLR